MLHKVLSAQLSDIRAAGTYKTELELVSPQGPAVSLAGVEGEVLNFCAPLLPGQRPILCTQQRRLRESSCGESCNWTCSQRHADYPGACCAGPA